MVTKDILHSPIKKYEIQNCDRTEKQEIPLFENTTTFLT